MKRTIIDIDQEKCTGCGACIPNCPEGAMQIIDGKARLMGDLFCDGLGACIGHCPEGAITSEEREAEPYDESKVMENIVKQGNGVIDAHLEHLVSRGQTDYHAQAIRFLQSRNLDSPKSELSHSAAHSECPGSAVRSISPAGTGVDEGNSGASPPSSLTNWPVQLQLMSPALPAYRDADVVLSADCVAYAFGDFHREFLAGKALAIACPKLDNGLNAYLDKITALVDDAHINTLTVLTMEVPCCRGLLSLATQAVAAATRKIPVKSVIVGINGEIRRQEWV